MASTDPAPPTGGASTSGPRRLPSGAVAIGPWTVAARPGRVYLHLDPAADHDLSTGQALDLAATVHAAALAAEQAAVDLDQLGDLDPGQLGDLDPGQLAAQATRPVEVPA